MHLVVAIRAGNEPIQRRRLGRAALGPIHPQIARVLVHLVLDQVERRDLDVCGEQSGWFRADREAVPWMRTIPAWFLGRRGWCHAREGTPARGGQTTPIIAAPADPTPLPAWCLTRAPSTC